MVAKKRGISCLYHTLYHAKRGMVVAEVIIDLILLVSTFLVLLAYAKSSAEGTLVEKLYVTRDQALLIDAIYAAPGNIDYSYTLPDTFLNMSQFNYLYYTYTVAMTEKNQPSLTAYPHYADLFLANNISFLTTDIKTPITMLQFSKIGDEITVGTLPEKNLLRQDCSVFAELQTQADVATRSFVVDPSHGDLIEGSRDRGYVNAQDALFAEAEVAYSVASYFATRLSAKLTREEQPDAVVDRLLPIGQDTDFVLSIHTGSTLPEENPVIAFIPPDSPYSQKFACIAINTLLEKYPDITQVAILERDDSLLTKNQGFGKQHVAVQFELGNIQIPREENVMLDKHRELAQALHEAINTYYGVAS
ncbi:hypothetical protein HYW21_03395 [Candidatus Woesearchaeota archaeon]|nr:hypothetical protein [Candidatus Woesearchaeota archaeon]